MVFYRLRIGGRISWLEYQTTPKIRRFIGFKLSGEEKPELGTFVFRTCLISKPILQKLLIC